MTLPLTVGIALLPRGLAPDWSVIDALPDLTLRSVPARTDGDFRVLPIAHDRPRTVMDGDRRLTVLRADWRVADTGPHNHDSGRKKHALSDHVLARGRRPTTVRRASRRGGFQTAGDDTLGADRRRGGAMAATSETPIVTRKPWWSTQSRSNPSLHEISLSARKLQGNPAENWQRSQ